jgi:DNA polymerase III subunit epsilon
LHFQDHVMTDHPVARGAMPPTCEHRDPYERAAELLGTHPDYRVLRVLPPLDRFTLPSASDRTWTIAVLDIETTSLDPATGKIIELAICLCDVDICGRIVRIGPVETWLEDPGHPLSDEIVRLTGLSDADLAGRCIDDDAVTALLGAAHLCVAHNAAFDARWIEARYPTLAGRCWACSLREVDWAGHGIESRKLGGLLADVAGFFNQRHRADADVAALVALLATELPAGRTVCAELIHTAMQPTVRLTALRAPFEAKDALKARGYRWSPSDRAWWIEVAAGAGDAECAWLATDAGCPYPQRRGITWHDRHRL